MGGTFQSGGTTLASMKAQSEAKTNEEKRREERRKAVLVLCLRHLLDNGYTDAAEKLQTEASLNLAQVDVADNIDLVSIIQEFEEYYEMRFNRKPKLLRKIVHGDSDPYRMPNGVRDQVAARQGGRLPKIHQETRSTRGKSVAKDTADGKSNSERRDASSAEDKPTNGAVSARKESKVQTNHGFEINGKEVKIEKKSEKKPEKEEEETPEDFFFRRVLKPMPDFGNSEMRELGMQVTRDIYLNNPDVRWGDIIGSEDAKRLLKEAVVMPIKFPHFFTGLLSPWKGILLYGPPGTGKTMLAKAVATECQTTFFNISASTIISKWRGDSEKLVRVLFELARYHSPSTIFMDELDALMTQRDGYEHEGSRRMKTELLMQMDGLAKTADQVFLLAASNLPWDLDTAMLRRLEKRILVPLQCKQGRLQILKKHLAPLLPKDAQWDWSSLADKTEGYSGSDIVGVCKEAAMRPIRRLMEQVDLGQIKDDQELKPSPISAADVEGALARTKPTSSRHSEKYIQWQAEFGAEFS
jgi:katanin p60 ATPase-containing subunit A1